MPLLGHLVCPSAPALVSLGAVPHRRFHTQLTVVTFDAGRILFSGLLLHCISLVPSPLPSGVSGKSSSVTACPLSSKAANPATFSNLLPAHWKPHPIDFTPQTRLLSVADLHSMAPSRPLLPQDLGCCLLWTLTTVTQPDSCPRQA